MQTHRSSALLSGLRSRAAAGTRGGVISCCCPALLLPALPAACFPGSHQRGTRAPSLPAAGGGKRKGLLFFSLPFCGSPGRWPAQTALMAILGG